MCMEAMATRRLHRMWMLMAKNCYALLVVCDICICYITFYSLNKNVWLKLFSR